MLYLTTFSSLGSMSLDSKLCASDSMFCTEEDGGVGGWGKDGQGGFCNICEKGEFSLSHDCIGLDRPHTLCLQYRNDQTAAFNAQKDHQRKMKGRALHGKAKLDKFTFCSCRNACMSWKGSIQ